MSPNVRARCHALPVLALTAVLVACSDDGGKAPEVDASPDPVLTEEDAGTPPSDEDGAVDEPEDAGLDAQASAPEPDAETDAAAPAELDLFDPSKLLDVRITLPAEELAALRNEGRTLNEVFSGCLDTAFDYVKRHASVDIAGSTFADVAVRKKGFLGSISVNKPSLRVTLDEYVADTKLAGTADLTLNNSVSDPSFTHQCMSYALFNAAGIPAPRCGFARVTVNDQELGVYVNVEPMKKPFLKAHFDDAKGDLYEGAVADFRTDLLGGFEKKTNESEPPSPLLAQLADALTQPEEAFLAALPRLIDVDQFLTFWAMESLVGHWDGYAGDLNNFYVYVDPTTSKLVFLPWGTDGAFSATHNLLPVGTKIPASVLAWARLPARLYGIPAMRQRYHDTLRGLLADHWDEAALLAEVDRIAALVGNAASPTALETMRSFVRGRRAAIVAELDAAEAPTWPVPERAAASCHPELNTAISGTFDTAWGSIDDLSHVLGNTLTASVVGKPVNATAVVSSAGVAPSANSGRPLNALRLVAIGADASFTVLQFTIGNPTITPGPVPLHGFETFGVLLTGPSLTQLSVVGFVGDGQLVFDSAGTTNGAPVKGRFDAKLVAVGVAPAGANN
jgi:spore coat protein H